MSQDNPFPIQFDWSGARLDGAGISGQDMSQLRSALEDARREIIEVDREQYKSGNIPAEKRPLDAGFVDLPERMLQEYRENRLQSELGQILATAQRLQESVDRVVVLGIGGSYMGARALMEACCHPYHNELSRADRGSKPRLYFEGNNVDNDAMQGLIELLTRAPGERVEDRWATIVISKSGGTLETAVAFRVFLDAHRQQHASLGNDWNQLIVPVTGREGKLRELAQAIGCPDIFEVPDGVGGRFSILSPVGLLPAALLGIDVVKLLEGAAMMNEHFQTAAPEQNVVLNYVGVMHLLEQLRQVDVRVMSVWAKSLEATGLWYDQLLAESLGKQEKGALPLTAVNTRDLHSRAQQHQEGKRDKLMVNLTIDQCRRDPLLVPRSEWDQDDLNQIAGRPVCEIMQAAIQGTNQAYADDQRPTVIIRLPNTQERTMGQLFQMLMLATVVEGRLMKINPYGQPGVEAYKRHMKRNLRIS
jgi:glucose-6-phosphate isomerase